MGKEPSDRVTTDDLMNEEFANSFAKMAVRFARCATPPTSVSRTHLKSHYESAVTNSQEVLRQIERIKPFLEWANNNPDTEIDIESLNDSISFLNLLSTGPTPIPVIGIGKDGKSSLFMEHDNHYLEANFVDSHVEYLFSTPDTEQFFEDKFERSYIPPNLLYLLYAHFARNDAQVEVCQ